MRVITTAVAIAGAVAALAAATTGTAAPTTEAGHHPAGRHHPVKVEVLAPERGDDAGLAGAGWFVDLELSFGHSTLAQTGFTGLQLTGPGVHTTVPPFPGAFAPGHDDRNPGLVVLVSTTNATSPGFSGPGTNLAGLFNLTGVTDRSTHGTELWDTWIVGAPIAGTDVDTTLTVAVVKDLNHNGIYDDAPDVVQDVTGDGVVDARDLTSLGVDSNVVTVPFHLDGDPA